jgi:hypothetical protein
VVIADNCSDATATVARSAGATVWERSDRTLRGKGHALAWALDRLLGTPSRPDAVAVVDADCEVSANFLRTIESRIAAGAKAVQVDYRVSNPAESPTAALRYAGYALVNSVRPLAKSRLGASAGLVGSGMAFSSEVLERLPWQAFSLTEDAEYHLALVASGERVVYAPEAVVTSAMPVARADTKDQRTRWELGRSTLARAWLRRLAVRAIRERDLSAAMTAVELVLPSQSVLAAATTTSLGASLILRDRVLLAAATLTMAGQAAYVFGGLLVAKAPIEVYRALALAPALVLDGLAIHGTIWTRRAPQEWIRTPRRARARNPAGTMGSSVGRLSAGDDD